MRYNHVNPLEVDHMKFVKTIWLILLSAIVLSACGAGATAEPTQDLGAIQTQAIQTVVAQFNQQLTQTAAAVSPTVPASLTPLATATLGTQPTFAPVGGSTSTATTPGVGTPFAFNTPASGFTPIASPVQTQSGPVCNDSAFVEDVTIPDGTEIHPGFNFTKSWLIKNTGTCMWDEGYVLVYQGGVFDGYDVPLKDPHDFVKPGDTHKFELNLTAPLKEGEAQDCWKMKADNGEYFGTYLCVKVMVD